jgi:hypothetical protein
VKGAAQSRWRSEDHVNVRAHPRTIFHGVTFEIYRDNGKRAGRILGDLERLRPHSEDRVDLESNQLAGEGRQAIVPTASILPGDVDVTSFDVSGLSKAFPKRREQRYELIGHRLIHENAYPPNTPCLLLRLDGKRRGEDAKGDCADE